jgi:hypothetical protein
MICRIPFVGSGCGGNTLKGCFKWKFNQHALLYFCDYLVRSSSLIRDRPLKMIELFGYVAWRARAVRHPERKDIPSNF